MKASEGKALLRWIEAIYFSYKKFNMQMSWGW